MSLRARHLLLYLAALAAGAVVAFALAASAEGGAQPPPSAGFTASNNYWYVTGTSSTTATIATGGSVTFSSPIGNNPHNATFSGPGPTSCNPPLPTGPGGQPPPWNSTCQFDTPGTYSFVCTVHVGMGGSVQVVAPGTPTTPPPTSGPGTPPGGNPPGGAPGQPGSLSVKVARRQRGSTVRGSVTTSVDNSRLAIKALVANRFLAKKPPGRKVSVGSLRKQIANAGKTSFAVKLNRAARRALNRRERLVVALRVTVTPPGAQATTKTARVTLRPA